jgi:WhiB family transcriptional regulator, redox-sensing transcriptional regulator
MPQRTELPSNSNQQVTAHLRVCAPFRPAMTLDLPSVGIPAVQPEQQGPADPRPAWERVAYTWLAHEVDAGQPVDPAILAREVSVAPGFAGDLLRLLRAQRDRDPALGELRARLVRDRITDAYLRRELAGDGRLDPAELAAEVGTSPAVARQWLTGLRAQHTSPQGLEVISEPVSHGRPTPEQLAGLQAHFAAGGHQHAAISGRPADPERLAAAVERHYWTGEVRAGQQLRPSQLARELGGDQRGISQQLAELRAGPSTASERIQQLWHQQDPGARPLSSSQLAWRLGVSDSYVRHLTWQLRTRSGQAPLGERLAATRQQLTSPPPPVEHVDGERDWRLDAACAQVDPELFFPDTGQVPQAAAAKAVCAGCAVRGPCLEAALHGPQARDDHTGIFAGTTARERVALRGRPSYAEGTRFVHDRAAAEAALALANERSIDRAAKELGVSKQALRRAFDHHGLPQPQVFQGGPRRTRFYDDRAAAEQAWRRAAEVGINQTRKELGVSDRALRTAWQRHGLGLPPRPTSRQPAATRRLDAAFLALNRKLLPVRAPSDQELAARVRRAEEYATLGADVVVEMGSETYGKRPAARAWAITRRAQRASHRASDRQDRSERRRADRASRTDRTSRARAQIQERPVTADAR